MEGSCLNDACDVTPSPHQVCLKIRDQNYGGFDVRANWVFRARYDVDAGRDVHVGCDVRVLSGFREALILEACDDLHVG